MKLIWGVLIILSLCVGAGCSSTQVYSDQVKGKNLKAYKTYAWLPNAKDTTDGSILDNEITYQNIRQAVDQEMRSRGYILDASNPDLLLLTHVMFKDKQDLVQNPVYSSSYNYYYPGFYTGQWYPYYYSGYYNIPYVVGYNITPVNYTEGTVIIDMIEQKTKGLVWRGWSEEVIDDYKDVNELYENVDKIFKEFPVKGK